MFPGRNSPITHPLIIAALSLGVSSFAPVQALCEDSTHTPLKRYEAKFYRDSLNATQITLRGPFAGLERFVFNDDTSTSDGTSHLLGAFRNPTRKSQDLQAATLSISGDTALLFFSSRRNKLPMTARFRISHTKQGLTVKATKISRSRPNNQLCSQSLEPFLGLNKQIQTTRPANGIKEVELGLFYDPQFPTPWPDQDIVQYLTAVTYAANQLYLRRIGVTLRIRSLVPTSIDLSGGIPSSDQLLELFRSAINSFSRSADLFHLFTRGLIDKETAGLAYVGAACESQGSYSVGLSRSVGAALQPIVLAHELAHGLGARHDDANDSLMNPMLTSANTRVSSATRRSVSSYIQSSGRCLTAPSDTKVSISVSTDIESFQTRVTTFRPPLRGDCALKLQARELIARRSGAWTALAQTKLLPVTSHDTSLRIFRGPASSLAEAAPRGLELRAVFQCGSEKSYSRVARIAAPKEVGAINAASGPKLAWWEILRGTIRSIPE
jgi:hypothetical protein